MTLKEFFIGLTLVLSLIGMGLDIWFLTSGWIFLTSFIIFSLAIFNIDERILDALPIILLIFGAIWLFRLMYIQDNLTSEVQNQSQVEKVQFFDDTKTVAYISSPSGQVSSEVLGEDYFKHKANFLEGKNCYLVSYRRTYSDFYENNITSFECY